MEKNFYDISVLVITTLPIFLTAFLFLIAAKINHQINTNDARIENLEARIKAEKDELYGLRVISTTNLKHVLNVYTAMDIHRRQIIDLMHKCKLKGITGKVDNFEKYHVEVLESFTRVSLFMSLIMPTAHSQLQLAERIDDLLEKFEDIETLDFLAALSKIESGDNQTLIIEAKNKLSIKLFGYNSHLWTG